MDRIISASEKGANLISGLLLFSRDHALIKTPFSINSVVNDAGKLLSRLLPEDVRIVVRVCREDTTVKGDANQISQILFNLATNARDAMPQGGEFTIETLVVNVDAATAEDWNVSPPGRYVLITISDTGTGMDEETRMRAFEPFFTTKEANQGTGLGLAQVYGIVKGHDGYVSVSSKPNSGTTFYVYLPAARRAGTAERQRPETPDWVPGWGKTILVAEDDDDVRRAMSDILRELGYTVIEALDGVAAVNEIKEDPERIDLMILDSIMPHKSGREVWDEAQKIRPDLKVLFMSGYAKDMILDKGLAPGCSDFLPKPISLPELLKKVEEMIGA
jgi:CheY-like chemotaxis protein